MTARDQIIRKMKATHLSLGGVPQQCRFSSDRSLDQLLVEPRWNVSREFWVRCVLRAGLLCGTLCGCWSSDLTSDCVSSVHPGSQRPQQKKREGVLLGSEGEAASGGHMGFQCSLLCPAPRTTCQSRVTERSPVTLPHATLVLLCPETGMPMPCG